MCDRGTATGSPSTRQAGYSIMELLVASTVMVVALLGVVSVLPTADQTIHYGGQKSKALSLAQGMLEMIKNDPYNNVSLYNGCAGCPTPPESGLDTRNPGTYPTDSLTVVVGDPASFIGNSNVVKWKNDISAFLAGPGVTNGYGLVNIKTVALDDSGTTAVLRKVTVTVGWTDSARDYKVQLSTMISGI